MADKKSCVRKASYGADFSRDMDRDPNMGMNPAWRRNNPSFKPGSFSVTRSKKK